MKFHYGLFKQWLTFPLWKNVLPKTASPLEQSGALGSQKQSVGTKFKVKSHAATHQKGGNNIIAFRVF